MYFLKLIIRFTGIAILMTTFCTYASNTLFYHEGKPAFSLSSMPNSSTSRSDQYIGMFPSYYPTDDERLFLFDPKKLAFALYEENGRLIGAGKAIGGATWCARLGRPCKTPKGEFKIMRKGTASCKSNTYPLATNGGAPMPHCMFFSRAGYAIHGSNQLPDINASHGCIRVETKTAHWLSSNFLNIGTKVVVLSY